MIGIIILSLLSGCILVQFGYAVYILVASSYECHEFDRWNDKIKRRYNLSD